MKKKHTHSTTIHGLNCKLTQETKNKIKTPLQTIDWFWKQANFFVVFIMDNTKYFSSFCDFRMKCNEKHQECSNQQNIQSRILLILTVVEMYFQIPSLFSKHAPSIQRARIIF